jgi:3-oxoacyl-[acyl-carrier-protein] synthase-3
VLTPCAGTCILFGDGCGAVLLSAAPDGQPCSLLGVDMHSDGNGQKSLHAMYSGCGGKPFQVTALHKQGTLVGLVQH